MKNIILIAITLATTLCSVARNYESILEQNLAKITQAQTTDELIQLSNTFDRIGEKEQDQWLPFYYASYSSLSILFFDQSLNIEDKKSHLADAQIKLNKALKITEQESELYILQAFIYQMSITDPSKGQKYSTKSDEALAKAKILNSENPRYYYLKGTNIFYTPEQYGGGKTNAKPLFQKANELFMEQNQENTLLPSWGKQHNSYMLQQCQ